ncbi:unnamed protein product [Larinioides sclopetarius]|uniref:Uncharacterized protein n=1 Tax=Larinioides sclopetarius TaxID=280406 RepID=A0AAV1ZRX9_9ARAC
MHPKFIIAVLSLFVVLKPTKAKYISMSPETLDVSTKINQLSVEVTSEVLHPESVSSNKTAIENYHTVDLQKYRVGYIVGLFGPLCLLCALAMILRSMKGLLCF